ncbi:MAG: DNA polymerase III subunit gamma/tau, partial [Rubrivivax sp.]
IDEAHQLTKDAFNALLKTLEEPPEYLKFVLATTDPEKMLPTVLSRCLQFNLRPMAPEVVQDHLAQVLLAEGVAAEPAALRLLGRAARGSMRDALSLTDQAIAYGAGRVDEAVVRAMLGTVDAGHAPALLDAVARRDGAALLDAVDALRRAGGSAGATLEAMAALLQAAAVEQAVPGATDDGDPDAPVVRALAAQLPADELQLLYSIVLHGRAELPLASDEHGGLTMLLLRLFAFPSAGGNPAPPPRVSVRPAALRAPSAATVRVTVPPPTAARPGPAPIERRPERVAVPPPAAVDPSDLDAARAPDEGLGLRWHAVVLQLIDGGHVSALTRELAWQAGLLAIEGEGGPVPCWQLALDRETLRAPALADRLAAALSELLGAPQQVRVDAGQPDDTPARRDAAARERRQRDAQQTIESDPVVRTLLSQFRGARIVPGSVKPLQIDGKERLP